MRSLSLILLIVGFISGCSLLEEKRDRADVVEIVPGDTEPLEIDDAVEDVMQEGTDEDDEWLEMVGEDDEEEEASDTTLGGEGKGSVFPDAEEAEEVVVIEDEDTDYDVADTPQEEEEPLFQVESVPPAGYFAITAIDCHVRDQASTQSASLNKIRAGKRLWTEPSQAERWKVVYMRRRTAFMHSSCFGE